MSEVDRLSLIEHPFGEGDCRCSLRADGTVSVVGGCGCPIHGMNAMLAELKATRQQLQGAVEAARKVLRDHEITDLEDGGRVYVDALALAELRDAVRALGEQ